MDSRRTRALRGTIAAFLATFLAALSHGVAGACEISPVALLLALISATFICVALSGNGLSRVRIALAVIASQGLYHVLFLAIPAGGASVVGTPAHHGPVQLIGTGTGVINHNSPAMWAAHALAAVATTAALIFGERAVRTLVRLLALLLRAAHLIAPLRRSWPVPIPASVRRIPARTCAALADSLSRRGPPAPAALPA
ncbi:hypothetical protein [Mycetocola spongiae]|uniref:hypothetical protein n=1 Tax=Mycetocola spongiae TaxID=2859226 RepID=UPI001CF1BD69|nr:hypothetical protein [Mycetocola spongiae]UCR88478.1 hypothetical protein KXZ72_10970 [Mycetocola spongiae]